MLIAKDTVMPHMYVTKESFQHTTILMGYVHMGSTVKNTP
jgi:hypothetical protein